MLVGKEGRHSNRVNLPDSEGKLATIKEDNETEWIIIAVPFVHLPSSHCLEIKILGQAFFSKEQLSLDRSMHTVALLKHNLP